MRCSPNDFASFSGVLYTLIFIHGHVNAGEPEGIVLFHYGVGRAHEQAIELRIQDEGESH